MDEQFQTSSSQIQLQPQQEKVSSSLDEKLVAIRDETDNAISLRNSFATDVHSYIRENIMFADKKAAFLFAAVTAVLAYFHQIKATRTWIKHPCSWQLLDFLSFISVLFLVLGAIFAFFVVKPRFSGARKGIVFWKAVAGHSSSETYSKEIMETKAFQLTKAKLDHCYELAKICSKKYFYLNWGIWFGAIGFIAFLVYLAIS